MKVIRKTISLEQFKSRMPSIIPSYDEFGNKHLFNHYSNKTNDPLTNYNMYPFNVQIPSDYGKYGGKIYSYNELSNIFHELDDVYTATFWNSCEKKHSNNSISEDENFYKYLLQYYFPFFIFQYNTTLMEEIIDYWKCDRLSIVEVIFWIDKMKQLSQGDCCDVKEYSYRGGDTMLDALEGWYEDVIEPIICTTDDYGHDFKYYVDDNMQSVRVKTIRLGEEKEIVYHNFPIYAAKSGILGDNRYIEYGKLNSDDSIFDKYNIEIINNVLTIPCLTSNVSSLIISEPYISLPLCLTNTMTNMGEMDVLAEEWESGYDYSNEKDTIVHYNNDFWKLRDNTKGYIYSTKYKEIYFANTDGMTDDEYINFSSNNLGVDIIETNINQWEKYFNSFDSGNLKINTYSYKDNTIVLNPDNQAMCDTYPIDTNGDNGYVLFSSNHNYTTYPVLQSINYIIIDNKNYRVYDNITPYCIYKGKKIKSNIINGYNGSKYFVIKGEAYEIFTNLSDCYDKDGVLVTITSENKIYGITHINGDDFFINESKMIVNNKHKWRQTDNLNDYSWNESQQPIYIIENENNIIKLCKPYDVYDSTKVSGITKSNIDEMILERYVCYDNLGNRLNGLYPINDNGEYKFNPSDGDLLGLPYIPNTVFEIDVEDEENNIWWGNILLNITIDGETYDNQKELNAALSGIYENGVEKKCSIEYYKGTMLSGTSNDGSYVLIRPNNDNNKYYGIKYISNFTIIPSESIYYKDEFDIITLKHFEMVQDEQIYRNDDYNIGNLSSNVDIFEYLINPFVFEYGVIVNDTFYNVNVNQDKVNINGTDYVINIKEGRRYIVLNDNEINVKFHLLVKENSETQYFDKFNGTTIAPLFRKENKLWQSNIEKISGDIYINRGTNRALDYHLRLMEGKSLESLMQVGNGFFKFINNNEQ